MVKQSKMAVVEREGQTYLIYSKYQSDHSDIYAIPIIKKSHLSTNLDIYNFSNWDGSFPDGFINSGTEITNNDTRTLMTKFNLNPYNLKEKSNNSISGSKRINFRYLYTGREYNIETGNYYYRARIMDSGIGRFTGKDKLPSTNRYYYVENKSLRFKDPLGRNVLEDIKNGLQSAGRYIGAFASSVAHGLREEGETFWECMDRMTGGIVSGVGSIVANVTGETGLAASASSGIKAVGGSGLAEDTILVDSKVVGAETVATSAAAVVGAGAMGYAIGSAINCR